MQGNGQVVIRIPELLTAIVHRLDAQDQRKLMPVSRYFFYFVGPIAWKRIHRIDFLMRLIKGVIVDSLTAILPRLFRYKILITLPPNPDLARCNVYAPWVRELEFFGERILQEIENPSQLLTLLDGRPLLPNLNRITVYSIIPITRDSVNLVNMFMNPSLKKIRTILHKKDERGVLRSFPMPWSLASIFIEQIEKACPQIHTLEFYPEGRWGGMSRLRDQCQSALSSFLNLRSFSSTTYILESTAFGTLGELPLLESLAIRGSANAGPVLDKTLSIPRSWFPSLKQLQLYEVHRKDIQALWEQPTIVRKLVSVLIQIDCWAPQDSPNDTLHAHMQSWISPFYAALPHLSPLLQDVAFYIGSDDSKVEIKRQNWESVSKGDPPPHFMAP
ncbi:hypothetical protein V565_029550 [Rhizoctonia solani 123E]|uniref:F-box domain-containing protein n=1 Tax=Rhizoctonia solani 123E TaxID=1423351 RepID=A0A074S2C6_9AGAM|nr:hypothetical protein V565_029550 [Rhizoctonia solani 123E]